MVAWDNLRNFFQDNRGSRVVHLDNRFGSIKLKNCATLDDYRSELKDVSDQLAAIGHPISEERLVLKLAAKLTPEYRTMGTLIQQSNPFPSFVEACSMLDLERRTREENDDVESAPPTALVAAAAANVSAYPVAAQPNSGGGKGKGKGKKKWNNKNSGKNSGNNNRGNQSSQNN